MLSVVLFDYRKTEETVAPLLRQLNDLQRTVADQQSQIHNLNAGILHNEMQIRQTPDSRAQGMK